MTQAIFAAIATINHGLRGGSSRIVVPYSKDTLSLLTCLRRNHLILGFSFSGNEHFVVFLHVRKVASHFLIYSSKRQNFQISAVELKKFENRHFLQCSPVYILLTAKGYLSHFEASHANLGGLLFGKLVLN
jgi:ribosomal protein S8